MAIRARAKNARCVPSTRASLAQLYNHRKTEYLAPRSAKLEDLDSAKTEERPRSPSEVTKHSPPLLGPCCLEQVSLAVQAASLAGMVLVNALMLSTYLRALQQSGSTIATVTNCATNFVLSVRKFSARPCGLLYCILNSYVW